MSESAPSPVHPHDNKWRTVAMVLLPVLGILLVILAIALVRPRDAGVVTVVYTDSQTTETINTGEVIDATDPAAVIAPRLGYRYKVFVEDESEDRSSGIARIGGRATFIPGARRGQTLLADITRVRDRVIDAVLVRVLSEITLPPKALPAAFEPRPGDPAGHVVPGAEMDVVIAEPSSKDPGGEGIAKVAGLVVVVEGAATVGERVHIRITDRKERIAFAEPTGQPAGTAPLATAVAPVRRIFKPEPGDRAGKIVPGAELDVTISEASAKNPDREGVARIEGLVIFVQGVTAIGERVNVRITERRDRSASAVPTGKPAGAGSAPPAGDVIRRVFAPGETRGAAAHVVAGTEIDVTISELSSKNPGTEGVAKVDGLVIFVEGATTVGETVRVRITARRERVAFAELAAP
jgi:predicted RNA-binding protein with TRAM domain